MALEVRIKKKLGDFRLDVSFASEGGIMALLGASGSGKSMTLKCIAGVETPDEGYIALDGRVLFDSAAKIDLSPQKRRVGYLFQSYALFPNMTARGNIECGVQGKKEERRRLAQRFIDSMQLRGLEEKYPHQLSGGQQQRVALARILASAPEAILLDEPFSALDSYLRWQLEMELTDLLADFQGPVVFVSHDRDEVYRTCSSVCVVNSGRSEPLIPVPALFESPGTLSAALLSGCKNYSRARKLGEFELLADDWGASLKTSSPVPEDIGFIGVRSHFVRLAAESDENTLNCKIIRHTPELFGTTLMLRPESAREVSAYSAIRIDLAEKNGKFDGELRIAINPSDIIMLR